MLNDAAYVGYELSEVLKQQGVNIQLLTRSRGIFSKTLGVTWNTLKADGIIHVHGAMQDATMARLLKSLDILHCHGTELRQGITLKSRWGRMIQKNIEMAKIVLYSTPDLEPYAKILRSDAIYLPNPVNTEAFYYRGARRVQIPRALYITLGYEIIPKTILKEIQNNGIWLDVVRKGSVDYFEMPQLLNNYDIFIDRFTIPSFSKTCLEAQSMGLSTIDYRHGPERVEDLCGFEFRKESGAIDAIQVRKAHDRRNIAVKLLGIYRSLG